MEEISVRLGLKLILSQSNSTSIPKYLTLPFNLFNFPRIHCYVSSLLIHKDCQYENKEEGKRNWVQTESRQDNRFLDPRETPKKIEFRSSNDEVSDLFMWACLEGRR